MLPRVAGLPHGDERLGRALRVLAVEERFALAARRAKCSKRCAAKL